MVKIHRTSTKTTPKGGPVRIQPGKHNRLEVSGELFLDDEFRPLFFLATTEKSVQLIAGEGVENGFVSNGSSLDASETLPDTAKSLIKALMKVGVVRQHIQDALVALRASARESSLPETEGPSGLVSSTFDAPTSRQFTRGMY